MSLATVKNNMYHSYASCTKLESDLSQLICILNGVDDSTANTVSEHISTMEIHLNTVESNFERMLELNKAELHIFFNEFNNKTSDMIKKLNKLSDDLDRLSTMADELYTTYILAESMGGFLEHILDSDLRADSLRGFIPSIVEVKNELQVFKMIIDTHNNKLRVGVRS